MAKAKKDNRVKRKRGKKFVFHTDDEKQAHEQEMQGKATNPFEEHPKAKRARRDAESREGLISEFKQRGKNSEFIDSRIGEQSSRLSEEDKMKLRFMRE